MTNQERIALLREAQQDIRNAMAKIAQAVEGSSAYDRAHVYTHLWLLKVVDATNDLADIGNIDDLIGYFEDDAL